MLTINSNLKIKELDKLYNVLIKSDIINFNIEKAGGGFPKDLSIKIINKLNYKGAVLVINDLSLEMTDTLLEAGYKLEDITLAFGKWNKNGTVSDDKIMYNIMNDFIKHNIKEKLNVIFLGDIFMGIKKWDFIIANPPYGKLHLKILDILVTNFYESSNIVSLQPIRWLQDPNAKEKVNSDFNKFKTTIVDSITDLEVLPATESQKYFDIVNGVDLGIYTFNKNANNKFNLDTLIPPLIKKIKSKLKTYPIFDKDKKDGWRARIPVILSGGKGGGNGTRKKWHGLGFLGPFYEGKLNNRYWYEYYKKNQHTKYTDTISNSISFGEDDIAAKNFCDSLNTTVGYYVTYNLISDVNVKPDTIMWLDTYSHEWNNKNLCEYFGITGFISDSEAEEGSEWEEILNWSKTINIWKLND